MFQNKVDIGEYDVNNIESMLTLYSELLDISEEISYKQKKLELAIKNYLKHRKWSSYNDPKTKISVSICHVQREKINKTALKIFLTDEQYKQIIMTETNEKLQLVTENVRKKLKRL
jgi:hypothetical protein